MATLIAYPPAESGQHPVKRLLDHLRTEASSRSAVWTTLAYGAQMAIRLASTLALTRLLAPDVFGLMAVATVFLSALNLMTDVGLVPSVVRSPRGDDPQFLRTVWTIQVIRGFLIAFLLCLMAFPVAAFYQQPALLPLLVVLSLNAIVLSFNSISMATCQRHMLIGRLTLIQLFVQVIQTIINVVAAYYLRSVWALVIGGGVGAFTTLLLSHKALPQFRHQWLIDRTVVAEVWRFGAWIFVGTALTFMAGEGSKAIMGALVPMETLGLITIATTLSWSLGQLVGKILSSSLFPKLSQQVRDDPLQVGVVLRRIRRVLLALTIPGFIVLSLVSQELIDLMYDERYAQSGVYLSIFALNGGIAVLGMPYQNVMLAFGDSRSHARVMFFSSVFRLGGLVAGFFLADVVGMITGLGVGTLLVYFISAGYARRRRVLDPVTDILSLAVLIGLYGYQFR